MMHLRGKILSSLTYGSLLLSLLFGSTVSLAGQPAVASAAYFGGSADEQANAVTTDAAGNVYITGWTRSTGLPGADVTQTSLSSGLIGYPAQDAFVTKLDAGGNVLFTRYIGAADAGSFDAYEAGTAITVDSSGSIYIAGTLAGNKYFSGSPGAFDNCDNGAVDAFVAVVDATDGALNYLSCFGGSNGDYATGLTLNSDGSVTIVGYTKSTDFPVTNDAFQLYKASTISSPDAFIFRLSPLAQGMADLQFASYLGGDGGDKAMAVADDSLGNLYVVGVTNSTHLLTGDTPSGWGDAYVARLNVSAGGAPAYDAPQYVHLFGSVNDSIPECDIGTDLAIDAANGHLYLTGRFESQGAFIARMDLDGGQVKSGIVGGSQDSTGCGVTTGRAIIVDDAGGGYIGGETATTDLPAGVNSFHGGVADAFVTRFDANLNPLYTHYLGGSGADAIFAMQGAASGYLHVAGSTDSVDWVGDGSSALQGGGDVLLGGLNPHVDLSLAIPGFNPVLVGESAQLDLVLNNSGPDAATAIVIELAPPGTFPGQVSVAPGSCTLTVTDSLRCSVSTDLSGGASAPLTVAVSSPQEGTWSLAYTLTSLGHEQNTVDNQGNIEVQFVTQLPPTLVVNNGTTSQVSAGGGGSGYFLAGLCLAFLAGTRLKSFCDPKPMK